MAGALSLRPIEPEDDAAVAAVIREVMPEFGASGPGFAIHDPEVDWMSRAYQGERSFYLVVVDEGRVVGGGGIAPLSGGDSDTCEVRKMYFRKDARGRGAGRALLQQLLDEARARGYRRCYLETLTGMDAAQHLYEALGFTRIEGARGCTGHFSCDRFFERAL
ncbi:MAG: GNAT family N-acetyltransferase [Deltaproteobacteria bacterium]|nr:GNAT family N-acetyltransferase [Deltaproteobacteria bacterium]